MVLVVCSSLIELTLVKGEEASHLLVKGEEASHTQKRQTLRA